jgi:hypothetical protein
MRWIFLDSELAGKGIIRIIAIHRPNILGTCMSKDYIFIVQL